jgi:hypothetical protein
MNELVVEEASSSQLEKHDYLKFIDYPSEDERGSRGQSFESDDDYDLAQYEAMEEAHMRSRPQRSDYGSDDDGEAEYQQDLSAWGKGEQQF